MAPRTLLLDACIAINLAATDHLDDIADTLETIFMLTRQAAGEVGHLRDVINGGDSRTPIDLNQHINAGTLQIITLLPAEYPLYIELAGIVDDGEASTIAVAVERDLPLATDDRKARRLCEQRKIPEPTRTLALIHGYAQSARLDDRVIHALLIKIRGRANFLPPRTDPDYKWWTNHIGSS